MEAVASILRKASFKSRGKRQNLQRICTQMITPPSSTLPSPVDTGSGIMTPPDESFLVSLVLTPVRGVASFVAPSGRPADPKAVRQVLGAEYFSLVTVDRFLQRTDRETYNITQLPQEGLNKFPIEIYVDVVAESSPYYDMSELARAEQRLAAEFNAVFAVFRENPIPDNLWRTQVAFSSIYTVRVALGFLLEQALDSRLQAKGTVLLVEETVAGCGCESGSTGKTVATPPPTPGLVSTCVEFINLPEDKPATHPLTLKGVPEPLASS